MSTVPSLLEKVCRREKIAGGREHGLLGALAHHNVVEKT